MVIRPSYLHRMSYTADTISFYWIRSQVQVFLAPVVIVQEWYQVHKQKISAHKQILCLWNFVHFTICTWDFTQLNAVSGCVHLVNIPLHLLNIQYTKLQWHLWNELTASVICSEYMSNIGYNVSHKVVQSSSSPSHRHLAPITCLWTMHYGNFCLHSCCLNFCSCTVSYN